MSCPLMYSAQTLLDIMNITIRILVPAEVGIHCNLNKENVLIIRMLFQNELWPSFLKVATFKCK